jgi:hypothetical protein
MKFHMKKMIQMFSLLAPLLMNSQQAFARMSFDSSAKNSGEMARVGVNNSTMGPFQVIMPNPSDESHRAIIQELLGANTPQLNWPAFPRTWTQFTDTTFQETNTSLGLTVNAISKTLGLGALTSIVNVGVTAKPYNISYRYTFDTTLVVMSSFRSNAPLESDKQVVPARDEELLRTIFDLDPKINKNYFKATDGHPMIGFCSFEARLEMATTSEFGISYMVGSSTTVSGKGRTLRHALYSNFFQIEPHVPVTDYLEKKCGQHFLKRARPYVEADFNKLVIEMNVHNNPKNECVIEPDGRPEGDNNCQAWHKSNFPSLIQKITVPRCVMGDKGISRCQLKSKKGSNCPLYLGRDGNITEQFQLYRDATLTGYAYRCDEGLQCGLDRNPKVLLGSLILWPGSATCK